MNNPTRIPDGYKRCARCKCCKLLTDFTVDRRSKSGRYCYCRKCNSKSTKLQVVVPPGFKHCVKGSQCVNPQGSILPATKLFFCRDRSKKDGFTSYCKTCTQKAHKGKYQKNPRKAIESANLYHKTHPEIVKKSRENYRATHKEKLREYNRLYSKTHRKQTLAQWHRRRARIAASDTTVTSNQMQVLIEKSNGKCCYCGKIIKGTPHLDHVIPLFKGGQHNIGNLVVACSHCNTSKGSKLPHEWNGNNGRLL